MKILDFPEGEESTSTEGLNEMESQFKLKEKIVMKQKITDFLANPGKKAAPTEEPVNDVKSEAIAEQRRKTYI